jgi:predicted ATPase
MDDQGSHIRNIHLYNLSQSSVLELLSLTLRLMMEECEPLADVVFRLTDGNMFFMKQYLCALQIDGILTYNLTEKRWQWDEQKIQLIQQKSSMDLMKMTLCRQPGFVQEILMIASALGAKFMFHHLSMLALPETVTKAIKAAIASGFTVEESVQEKYRL